MQDFTFYGKIKYKGTITSDGKLIGESYLDNDYKMVRSVRYHGGEKCSDYTNSSHSVTLAGTKFYVKEQVGLNLKSVFTYDELMRLISVEVYDLEENKLDTLYIYSYIQDTNIVATYLDAIKHEYITVYYNKNNLYTYINMNTQKIVATYSNTDKKCITYYDTEGNVVQTMYKDDTSEVADCSDGSYIYSAYNKDGELIKYISIMPDEDNKAPSTISVQTFRYDDENREIYSSIESRWDNLYDLEETESYYNKEGLIDKEVISVTQIDKNGRRTNEQYEYNYNWEIIDEEE